MKYKFSLLIQSQPRKMLSRLWYFKAALEVLVFKKLKGQVTQRGDTIVEVMLSVSVLAVVLATAYATSTRSLQSGLDAKYRGEALSYAQAQLELIKNADNNSPSTVGGYKLDRPFCINPANAQVQEVDSTSKVCPLPIGADPASQLPYTIVNTYDAASKTFVSKIQWQTSNNKTNQVVLYYKSHNSFVDTPGGSCPLCTSQSVTAPPAVGVSFSANPTSVGYNGTSKLSWTSTNATSCTASGGWSGSRAITSPPGGEQVGPLSSSTTFYLTCTNGGSSVQKQVTVAAAAPPSPALTFTADSYSVGNGGNTTLRWSTTNVPSNRCNASGAWNGSVSSPGSTNTGALSAGPHTYTLNCNGFSGTNSAQGSVTVTASNPPRITAFGTWSESTIYTSRGAPRYLYWYSSDTSSCSLSGYGGVGTNSYVYINVYPGTYTLTCYSSTGSSTSATYAFNYHSSAFTAYQHARFDGAWPGWTWSVGEGYYGLPSDTSSFSVYGRAAVRDNYGHCASFTTGGWQLYGWVEDYGLRNDSFGSVDVGHDCSGN